MIRIPKLAEVEAIFRDAITAPDERSKQVKIGASEIGGCPFCVGYTLARKFYAMPERQGFGYAAWIGTMCHYWLERELKLPAETLREHKVPVGELAGYGTVKGTADLVIPEWRRLIDYKFPGEYSYKKLKLSQTIEGKNWRPSNQYRYQQQLLAHGLRAAGVRIDMCTIAFFPRHTNSYRGVLWFEEPYNPNMVTLAMQRLEAILEDVLEGRLEEIDSDPDCFLCEREGRPYIKGYQALAKTETKTETETETGANA